MGPGERNIQHELRRQAAQVPIPRDMWEKISGQLDADRGRSQRPQQAKMRMPQWKPALALVAAAGMLWLTVAPTGSGPGPEAAIDGAPTPIVESSSHADDTLRMRPNHRAYNVHRPQPEDRPSVSDGALRARSQAITAR